MALADDIRVLRDRTLAELNGVHDYYSHSESAWNLVRQTIATNPSLSFQNLATGNVVSGQDLSTLARDYAARHILDATFQQFLSLFEVFVADLLRLWLTAFPRAIGGKTATLEEVLDAG